MIDEKTTFGELDKAATAVGEDASAGAGESVILVGPEDFPEGPLIGPDPDSVILELGDLLPDASGEVVLFTGEDTPVNILTSEVVTGSGVAEPHVTATGVDVTGLNFYVFESGIIVYSPTDVLIVNGAVA